VTKPLPYYYTAQSNRMEIVTLLILLPAQVYIASATFESTSNSLRP